MSSRESFLTDWSFGNSIRYSDTPESWSPDTLRNCEICLAEFSIRKRRHHCRKCGCLACDNCSKNKLVIPRLSKSPLRACDSCYNRAISNPVKDMTEVMIESEIKSKLQKDRLIVATTSNSTVKMQATVQGISRAITGAPLGKEIDVVYIEGINSRSNRKHFTDENVALEYAKETAALAFKSYQDKFSSSPNFSIGIEPGITVREGIVDCYSWIAIYNGTRFGTSRSTSFNLPPAIAALVLQGFHLNDADSIIFHEYESYNPIQGSIGFLTKGKLPKVLYLETAVTLAFLPFEWSSMYETMEV